jgi:hypothetical protein
MSATTFSENRMALAREQAEYEAKMAARAAKAAATGQKPRGRAPVPPVEGPGSADQVNLTDEESRIMPVPGGGFEQCYTLKEQIVHGRIFQTIDAVRAFVARYNVEWLIEKNGHRSPAHIRAVWQAQLSPHSENVQRFQRLKPM